MKFFFKFFSLIFIFISFILVINNFKLIESLSCATDEGSIEDAVNTYADQFDGDAVENNSKKTGAEITSWLNSIN
jgi:hypothetical protein|tara:strand:+ start:95 stop:319 length:225 start_codon:yes stop_codon:yes gene_type:complete